LIHFYKRCSAMSGGDDAVQSTNDDATMCKLSAVSMGYWPDPFLPHMARQACRYRRAPEIHLGYFARVAGVRMLIDKFFEACDTAVQVINLGAGFDTTFWRLLEEGRPVKNFIEIDFSGVSARKCHLIKSRKELMGLVAGEEADIKLSKTELHSTRYHLVSADFTDLPVLESKLAESEVSFSCPTLILAECALVYVDQAKTSRMMSWLAAKFSSCTFVNYEQLDMNDRFGQVMLDNLMSRGCMLAGVAACKDKDTQVNRFTQNGWDSAQCWNMNEVYSLLPQSEVQRVEAIERLDEKELLRQLFDHYCITVARKNSASFNFDSVNFD